MTIQDVMKKHINVKIDEEYYNKLNRYRVGWCNKSQDYTEFLGSGLTGVHAIRFSDLDTDKLYTDILNVDKNLLTTDLHSLKDIHADRNVTGNAYYLTSVYMIYLTSESKLNQDLKNRIIEEHYYLIAYKMLSSLYSRYFEYNVDTALAKAVYEKLSNHFIIKTEGSWQKVFEYRAKHDILPGGLWYKRLPKMNTIMTTKIVSDIQSRIREMLKYIYKVLIKVKESNEKISSTTLVDSSDEDGDGIKENSTRSDMYITYMRSIFNRPNDFVNDDLIYLISQVQKNVNIDQLTSTLKYMSETIELKEGEYNIVENILLSTFDYINKKGIHNDYNKHIGSILIYMKGHWSSSSVKDSSIKESKLYLTKIVKEATGIKTQWFIASIVICVAMYIFTRSLYRNQY